MDDDTDEKDDTKRKSRNLSEKKRRDQFNLLVNELSSMVSANNRKMDKSTVLKSTIAFLRNHNEIAVRSRAHEIQEDWKPAFLSNEEFTHLILEALDGFIIVFSSNGKIIYASESITSLLGHLPSDLLNMTIYDLSYEEDHTDLYNLLLSPSNIADPLQNGILRENQVVFSCHLKRGGLDFRETVFFELVQFTGYFRSDVELENMLPNVRTGGNFTELENRLIFVGTGRLQTPQLIREMSIVDSIKNEFTSRHSLEWKFLFLDHRAPPIIGYLPFEVLGTSGYDYYHFDDLEKVIACHEALLQKGEGTSCYYRFLTKGQQWIWLQTRFYITYHQWNSKPEFVVCTHRVVSYADVMKQTRNNENLNCGSSLRELELDTDSSEKNIPTSSIVANSPWSSKNSRVSTSYLHTATPSSASVKRRNRLENYNAGTGSDTSLSADSMASRQSLVTQHSSRSRVRSSHGSRSNSSHQMQHPSISQSNINHYTINQSHTQLSINPPQLHQVRHTAVPPQLIGPTFLEPPQYLAAIPVHPVIGSGFPATSVISPLPPPSELMHPNVVMTSAQNQIQEQLQRKHEELQHLIVQQQEELRRVSEQLIMARYGLIPTIVNVPIPFTSNVDTTNPTRSITSATIPTQSQHIPPHLEQHHPLDPMCTPSMQPMQSQSQASLQNVHNPHGGVTTTTSDDMISYIQLSSNEPPSHMMVPQQEHQPQQQQQQQTLQIHQTTGNSHQHQVANELEVMPFQMSQAQAQIIFSSNIESPASTQHSQ